MTGTNQTPIANVFDINRFCIAMNLLTDNRTDALTLPAGLTNPCLEIAQAAFRIPYATVAPTAIRPFFDMKGKMPAAPLDLLKRCTAAMLAADIDALKDCDQALKSLLPHAKTVRSRWEIVFNWFYLTECVKTVEDASNLESLFFVCGKGFWDVIRHRYFECMEKEKTAKRGELCDDLLWRSAKRVETFRLINRPIVSTVCCLLRNHHNNPFWDDTFFRSVFNDELLSDGEAILKCISCLDRERLNASLVRQCADLNERDRLFLSKKLSDSSKVTVSKNKTLICTKSGRPCSDTVIRLLADMIAIALWIKNCMKRSNEQSALLAVYLAHHLAYWMIEFDQKGRKDNTTFPMSYLTEDRCVHFHMRCQPMFRFLKNFLDTDRIPCYRLWSLVNFDSRFGRDFSLQLKARNLDLNPFNQDKRLNYSRQMGLAGVELTQDYLRNRTIH